MSGDDTGPELLDPDSLGRAVDAGLSYLSYRPRTRQEVERKLQDRGFEADLVQAALERLEELGLIDDLAFIELYTRDRIARRPMGVRRIVSELYRKGIEREVATRGVQQTVRQERTSERALAERAARKRYRALSGTADELTVRRKLYGHLARRGFPSRIARDVVHALLDDPAPRAPDAPEGPRPKPEDSPDAGEA